MVESALEVDRLFWLDPKNRHLVRFERACVDGETDTYVTPLQRTRVVVQRWGRTFLVDGIAVLQIVDNPKQKQLWSRDVRKKKDHHTGNALRDYRISLAKIAKEAQGRQNNGKKQSDVPDEERQARAEIEHMRQAARRAKKAAQRQAIQESKRNE